MSDGKPKIDFTRIAFPSDKLTIGKLREMYPNTLTSSDLDDNEKSLTNINIISMFCVERELAEEVFANAIDPSIPIPKAWHPDDELEVMVANIYKRSGLAKGDKHAEELIRDLKNQVKAQAKEALGQGR